MKFKSFSIQIVLSFISGLLLSSCSIVNDSFGNIAVVGSGSQNPASKTLVSLQVTPASVTVPLGRTQTFRTMAVYSDGSKVDVSTTAMWSSENETGAAAVGSQGLVDTLGGSQGAVVIKVRYSGLSGQASLTVAPPALVSLALSASSSTLALGTSESVMATGTYTDQSQSNLSTSVNWNLVAGTGYAAINSSGLVNSTGGTIGTVLVSASLGGVSGTYSLTIGAAALVSIAVFPTNPSVALGNTQSFTATGTYTDGSNQDITSSVTWTGTNGTGAGSINSSGLASTSAQGTVTITANRGAISGNTTMTISAPTLVSIAVTPSLPSVALGNPQQMVATGTYTDGSHQTITGSVAWSSTNGTGSASINSAGLATTSGGSVGTVTLTATLGAIAGSTTLTITSAVLVSIAVTPANPTVALGNTQQFTATGTYSDSSTQNISGSVTWSSVNGTGSGSINGSGLSSTTAQGTVTIKATLGAINGSTTMTVGAVALTSIVVTPANQSTALGNTQQYTATGHYSDGSTQNISATATWSVIPGSGAATISGTGLLNTIGGTQGSITVQAVQSGVTGSTSATIGAIVLSTITVSPANPNVALGNTQQFTATGHYSDSSTQDLTGSVTWTAVNGTGSGSISSSGLASTTAQGTVTVTATLGAISGNTTMTIVAAALVSIAVTPSAPSVALGNTQQFTATGTYTDSSQQNITATVTWSSSNVSGQGSVNSSGLASTIAQGTVTITATSGSITGNATLTVTSPALVSIAVTPTNPSVPLGNTQQFTATGTYTDTSTQNITGSVTWSKTNGTGSASINSSGLASTFGGTLGTVTITATSGSLNGTATLTVTAAALVSIAVTPTNPSVPLGNTEPFTATGTYTDGTNQNLTATATWTATAGTGSASINASGLASTVGGAQGTVTITATSGSINGSTTLTVAAPALVSLALTPANPSVPYGSTEPFTATGTYTDGSNQNLTATATWSAVNGTGAATINSVGLATTMGGSQGTVTIEAASGAINNSTVMTIVAPALVSIAVTPANPSVVVGHTQQFTATGTYSDSSQQNLTSTATWSTIGGTGSGAVNSSGLGFGSVLGTFTMVATYSATSGNTTVTVTSNSNITTVAGEFWTNLGLGGSPTGIIVTTPEAVKFDSSGNWYFTDSFQSIIRKVNVSTGAVSNVAGLGLGFYSTQYSGDGGPALSAGLTTLGPMAIDSQNNIYISDGTHEVVRQISASTGDISIYAGTYLQGGFSGDGGPATSAKLNYPGYMAFDSNDNLYIADELNSRIRMVNASTGQISTVVGNGTPGYTGNGGLATSAEIDGPGGIFVDGTGNIYFADTNNGVIREVSAATGLISTVAGNGTLGYNGDGIAATAAELNYPNTVIVDASNNLYIADSSNDRIRKVSSATGKITTYAGNGTNGFSGDGGAATSAEVQNVFDLALDSSGNLYLADGNNYRVRLVNASTGVISTVAGNTIYGAGVGSSVDEFGNSFFTVDFSSIFYCFNGDGLAATSTIVYGPIASAFDGAGNLYIVDANNDRIRKVSAGTGIVSTFAGTGTPGFSGDGGAPTSAKLNEPNGIAIDSSNNVYIADFENYRIRMVSASTGKISTIAGNGTAGDTGDGGAATSAQIDMNNSFGLALDSSGNIYFADGTHNVVREINVSTGKISRVAGNGSPGYTGDGGLATSAELYYPYAVAVDTNGNIYISDAGNFVVRKVTASTGKISTIVGTRTYAISGDGGPAIDAETEGAYALAVDSSGNLYLADVGVVRMVNANNGYITTIAGNGTFGYSGDGGPPTSAQLDGITGLTLDSSGNLYLTDAVDNVIRKFTP